MHLELGRPLDCSSRLEKENRVYDLLEQLGLCYQRLDHEPAMTMEICDMLSTTLDAPICKNLLLCNRQETAFYLLLLPGDKPFKTKDLSAQIGSARLSFASAQAMADYLDITPGSLSVLGLMNDHGNRVQLLIDADVLASPWIGVHPCINTSTLRLKTDELMRVVLPAMGHTAQIVHLPRLEL